MSKKLKIQIDFDKLEIYDNSWTGGRIRKEVSFSNKSQLIAYITELLQYRCHDNIDTKKIDVEWLQHAYKKLREELL